MMPLGAPLGCGSMPTGCGRILPFLLLLVLSSDVVVTEDTAAGVGAGAGVETGAAGSGAAAAGETDSSEAAGGDSGAPEASD